MTRARIAKLRDEVLSLEILVDLFADLEDKRLPRTKRQLTKARADLAAAEAGRAQRLEEASRKRSLDEQYDALVMSDPTGREP